MKRMTTPARAGNTKPSLSQRLAGYWLCYTCDRVTEPKESDHGQPTGCVLCGSPRIKWQRGALNLQPLPDLAPAQLEML